MEEGVPGAEAMAFMQKLLGNLLDSTKAYIDEEKSLGIIASRVLCYKMTTHLKVDDLMSSREARSAAWTVKAQVESFLKANQLNRTTARCTDEAEAWKAPLFRAAGIFTSHWDAQGGDVNLLKREFTNPMRIPSGTSNAAGAAGHLWADPGLEVGGGQVEGAECGRRRLEAGVGRRRRADVTRSRSGLSESASSGRIRRLSECAARRT